MGLDFGLDLALRTVAVSRGIPLYDWGSKLRYTMPLLIPASRQGSSSIRAPIGCVPGALDMFAAYPLAVYSGLLCQVNSRDWKCFCQEVSDQLH